MLDDSHADISVTMYIWLVNGKMRRIIDISRARRQRRGDYREAHSRRPYIVLEIFRDHSDANHQLGTSQTIWLT